MSNLPINLFWGYLQDFTSFTEKTMKIQTAYFIDPATTGPNQSSLSSRIGVFCTLSILFQLINQLTRRDEIKQWPFGLDLLNRTFPP